MTDIREWLQALGLEKYASVFAEHEITLDILPELTEADIGGLGLPTGPRRRLMVAIQARAAAHPAQPPVPQTSHEAERRQLTVMFCDLVGSTAPAERLDPEELRDLMQDYQRACRGVIEKYDGHVAQYLGDGLLVYFGWPRAHEDDAVRAIRVGLEVTEAVSRLMGSMPLRARVGIHTGLVVQFARSNGADIEAENFYLESIEVSRGAGGARPGTSVVPPGQAKASARAPAPPV